MEVRPNRPPVDKDVRPRIGRKKILSPRHSRGTKDKISPEVLGHCPLAIFEWSRRHDRHQLVAVKRTGKNKRDSWKTPAFSKSCCFWDYTLVGCNWRLVGPTKFEVHMAYIGHPVAGDPAWTYSRTKDSFFMRETSAFIHAQERLEFTAEVPAAIFEKATGRRDNEGWGGKELLKFRKGWKSFPKRAIFPPI